MVVPVPTQWRSWVAAATSAAFFWSPACLKRTPSSSRQSLMRLARLHRYVDRRGGWTPTGHRASAGRF